MEDKKEFEEFLNSTYNEALNLEEQKLAEMEAILKLIS